MLLLVVVGYIKAVCRQREAINTSGDNAASPRLADTAERDYFTLRESWSICKQLEGTQKYINEQQADKELPISMGNDALLWAILPRFQRSINA